jgi:triosephosphate isomerase (TIM)
METIINFKTYNFGKKSLKLAKEIEKQNKNAIVGVQITDIYPISKNTKLQVYAQHSDCFTPGRATGFITPESIKGAGAVGVLLNHSEHPIDFPTLEKTIKRCKEIKLKTAVFASDLKASKKIESLKPDFLIYEPPELVAGNISVSDSKPEIIKQISGKIKLPVLVGAGIKTKKDIDVALSLGAKGIALSSAITTSKNPKKVMKQLGI